MQGNPNDLIITTPIPGATLVRRRRKSRTRTSSSRKSQPFFPTTPKTAVSKGVGAVDDPIAGTFGGFVPSTIKDAQFGTCVPTMKFEAGLNGRKETEFTFQAIDPKINAGQVEDLDPNVIAKRISSQVTSICGANQVAKDATAAGLIKIAGLGTKDSSTADAWNSALGFAKTDTNPDKAPKSGLIGHA
ncbi:Bgt-1645 [Blumeria graminis f. sp. tritici]|uniref:Bgt-1645 n=3 Tax=Blumeria graminis TaxID=34373 RepID=A0A9X9MLP3_BLUGR|nr:hypothetical protein BGT96224_1645 [Blumeria graminis f. sp. tritici 96224]VDB90960.1 Bgt-1645 [Blumeria graminis f. sp. tritici]